MSSNTDRETVSHMLAEAEKSLRSLNKASITELLALRQPPISVRYIIEGLAVLLAPSLPISDWNQLKKWLSSINNQLLNTLIAFDKEQITDEQLEKLKIILSRPECDPTYVQKCSMAAHNLCIWLIAMSQYAVILREYNKLDKQQE